MRLVDPEGRAPPHAIVSPVVTRDGIVLRTARWQPSPRRRDTAVLGTVLVCDGRTEFIEKYFEVAGELVERGFAAVVFDWRGQGLSGRLLRNPRKGHVRDFADYRHDLGAVVNQVLEPFCPRPWFALAHSMGAPIALRFALEVPGTFARLVLSAPMVAIANLRATGTVRAAARALRAAGLGTRFVPGGGDRATLLAPFEGNPLTSDPERYARMASFLIEEPSLRVGAPTIGWLHAAFEAMAELAEDAFLNRFATPTLTLMPSLDRVVDPRAAERLVRRMRAADIVMLPEPRHEILMERDALRAQFWAAFDAFVPGAAR